jgi:hypothetical protein
VSTPRAVVPRVTYRRLGRLMVSLTVSFPEAVNGKSYNSRSFVHELAGVENTTFFVNLRSGHRRPRPTPCHVINSPPKAQPFGGFKTWVFSTPAMSGGCTRAASWTFSKREVLYTHPYHQPGVGLPSCWRPHKETRARTLPQRWWHQPSASTNYPPPWATVADSL